MSSTRRSFLKRSAMAAAATGAPALFIRNAHSRRAAKAAGGTSPNDKIVVGAIGINGMGFSDLRSLLKVPNVECGALCDVDQDVLAKRASEIYEMTSVKPAVYGDYRQLLDNKEIDAVVIGTPDHWHCLQMIHACEAGKDVYVEKPIALNIEECQLMIRAAKRYGRVVQVGQWQRSGKHWDEAVAFVHSGKLGRIRAVRAWAYMSWMPEVPDSPDEAVPDGVDYDMWLGPARKRPFNRNRFHFNFRWYWDYAGGLMTDWGVHLIDIALYGMRAKAPRSVVANGGKFAYPDDAQETPDTLQTIYEYDDFSMIWEHAVGIALGPFQRAHGVAFIGNNGTLVVDRSQWEIYPEVKGEAYKMEARPVRKGNPAERGLDQHTANFIECMRTRKRPKCDIETGSIAAVNSMLGNIAFRTDAKVHWNAKKMEFKKNDPANALTQARYRKPWKLPKV